MSHLHLEINHSLTEQEALKRIKKQVQAIKAEYGNLMTDIHESWKGNKGEFTFIIKGYNISLQVEVTRFTIVLDGELPWSLGLFKSKIEKIIRERATILLVS